MTSEDASGERVKNELGKVAAGSKARMIATEMQAECGEPELGSGSRSGKEMRDERLRESKHSAQGGTQATCEAVH